MRYVRCSECDSDITIDQIEEIDVDGKTLQYICPACGSKVWSRCFVEEELVKR